MSSSRRSLWCRSILGLACLGPALAATQLRADAEAHRAAAIAAPQPQPLTATDLYALPTPAFAREIRLAPLDVQKYLAEDAAAPFGPVRTGVARDLLVTAADGQWQSIAGAGWLWTVSVVSEQATAVRLHFAGVQIPDGGQLFVRDGTGVGQVEGPYDGRWLDETGALWTTDIFGDQALVEYFEPAAGAEPPQLPFVIDRLMHNYHWIFLGGPGEPREGSCHNDVTCYPSWQTEKQATARISFVSGSAQVLCSGALIATQIGDGTPYFLTANHCIDRASEASSMTAYWFYQTSVCNGAPPLLISVPNSAHATILAMSDENAGADQTLLMIDGALPAGVGFAGWTTSTIGSFVDCTGIHHPDGAYKRISFGQSRTHPWGDNTDYVGVTWSSGTIEPGSSGSGLYRDSDRKLIGVASHSAVPIGCSNPDGPSGYGRFSRFYPTISSLLVAGGDDDLEDNDTCATAAAIAAGSYLDRVVKSTDEDWYRISVGACEQLTVTASFASQWGNIDMALYDGCGLLIDTSTGFTGTETVSVDNLGPPQDYQVRVYVSFDTRAEYDLTVTLTPIGSPPTITDQPDSQAVNAGDPVTFEVVATGDGPLSYQWKKDGSDISGANSSTYTIASAQPGDAGNYACEVSNDCGLVTSDVAVLTVTGLPGDFDGDGDVDLDDFGVFAACYNGANNAPAAACPEGVEADLDGDGDVDLDDFSIFAAAYTGSQ